MRNLFPGYYTPTSEEFERMWHEWLFVPDANVLLNLYRYSPKTSQEFLNLIWIMGQRKSLWLPHQIAAEFLKRRLDVIVNLENVYNERVKVLRSVPDVVRQGLERFGRHPHVDIEGIVKRLDPITDEIAAELERQGYDHVSLFTGDLREDNIKEHLTRLFEERVGNPYSPEQLAALYKEADARYEKQIPPGYADVRDKKGVERYGDFILWRQILDHAKEHQRSVVFITDDAKEDWWWLDAKKRRVGARPELVQEMSDIAGVGFYMYSSESFIGRTREFLQQPGPPAVLEEIREVVASDEAQRRIVEEMLRPFADDLFVTWILTNAPPPPGTDVSPERLYHLYQDTESVEEFMCAIGIEPEVVQDVLRRYPTLFVAYSQIRGRFPYVPPSARVSLRGRF